MNDNILHFHYYHNDYQDKTFISGHGWQTMKQTPIINDKV
jgi:hypothetical protein